MSSKGQLTKYIKGLKMEIKVKNQKIEQHVETIKRLAKENIMLIQNQKKQLPWYVRIFKGNV